MSLFGVIICAISVGIFKIAALGVDPFQSLMAGLDKLIPIPFGTLYVIVNVLFTMCDPKITINLFSCNGIKLSNLLFIDLPLDSNVSFILSSTILF
jgi:uncharacterized membrane protein YczE